ncbi:GOLPH3/VPS74 family protein [Dactylosporangium darangshiense]|uniref:GOLPH3/VPS74 family protein n=1 Tax=Dactylosporangium darangshiense TaxID=579108 RepID=UPI003627926E
MQPRPPLFAEYFLLAHDGYSGRPHIDAALLGAGVAGALLGELALAGHIRLGDGAVRVTGTPPDPVGASTADTLRGAEHGAERWIELLASAAYAMVGDDLVRAGVVRRPRRGASSGWPGAPASPRPARVTSPRTRSPRPRPGSCCATRPTSPAPSAGSRSASTSAPVPSPRSPWPPAWSRSSPTRRTGPRWAACERWRPR